MNDKRSCLDRGQVLRWLNDELSANTIAKFEGHIEQCADCQSLFHELLTDRSGRETDGKDTNPRISEADTTLPGQVVPGPMRSAPSISGLEITSVLGQGGMGVVYRARQARHGREVAVKLVKSEWISEEFFARFDREITVLASMEHPNIARLYDVGQTDDGRVYIVMEYVDGEPIDAFCAKNQLSVEERLELFVRVCDIVQDLHNSQVVHRDLKPSNILIRKGEEGPEPVLIDFGLAKFVSNEDAQSQELTQGFSPMGSIRYMSPEQARGISSQVNALTDEYSLGAILYLLLTGDTPLDKTTRQDNEMFELLRRIQENEVPPPSHSVDRLRDGANVHLSSVGISRASLKQNLAGDLDAITLRSLRLEANERYASVAEFASDLRRLLNDEVVIAREPTRGERLRKFYRKNRGITWATFAFVLLCIMAVGGTSYGFVSARTAERDTRRAFLNESAEREKANERLENFLAASEIMQSVFNEINPERAAAGDAELRSLLIIRLKSAAEQINTAQLGDTDEVYGLKSSLANALNSLGDSASAVPIWEEIVARLEREKGEESEETIEGKVNLAVVLLKCDEGVRAQDILMEMKDVARDVYPPGHIMRLSIDHYIASTQAWGGHPDMALKIRQYLVGRFERAGLSDHPICLDSLNSLGMLQLRHKQYPESIKTFAKVLEGYQNILEDSHPIVFTIRTNLAMAQAEYGQADIAIQSLRVQLSHARAQFPAGSMIVNRQRINLATVLAKNEQSQEAVTLLEEGIEHAVDYPIQVKLRAELALAKIMFLNRVDEGTEDLKELLHESRARLGPTHEFVLYIARNLELIEADR